MKCIRFLNMLGVLVLLASGFAGCPSPKPTPDLHVGVSGQGQVNMDPATIGADAFGVTVTLSAVPAQGWHFDHWEGSLSGNANPASFSLDEAKDITAVFAQDIAQYTLTTSVSGQGSVTLSPPGGTYAEETAVTATATAASGWHFDHWEGAVSGVNAVATVLMDANTTLTAVFLENPPGKFSVTVGISGQGTVALDPPGGAYDAGTGVTLTATPASGWHFSFWTGGVTGSQNPVARTLNADLNVTAVFDQDPPAQYTLQVTNEGCEDAYVTVAPARLIYLAGDTVTLTAVAPLGYHLHNWEGALTGSANPVSITMDSNKTINAVFGYVEPLRQFGLGTLECIALTPDRTGFVTGCGDGKARLWNVVSGQVVQTFGSHFGHVTAVAISGDGTRVATAANDGSAKVWDIVTGKCLRTIAFAGYNIEAVALSPTGSTVVTAGGRPAGLYTESEGKASAWDIATGSKSFDLVGHTDVVRAATYSADGLKVATASDDKTAKIWDAASGNCLRTCQGHTDAVCAVAFSPDGATVLTGSKDHDAILWNATSGVPVHTLDAHAVAVTAVSFSLDGTQVLTCAGNGVITWETVSGNRLMAIQSSPWFDFAGFLADGLSFLATGGDTWVRTWDIQAATVTRLLARHTAPVTAVAYAPDAGEVLAGYNDGTAMTWDAHSGAFVHSLAGHTYLNAVAYSPNGNTMATGGTFNADPDAVDFYAEAKTYDTATATVQQTLHNATGSINALMFSPDNAWLLASGGGHDHHGDYYGEAVIHNLGDGTVIQRLKLDGIYGTIRSAVLSADAKSVVTGSEDYRVRLWDIASANAGKLFEGHGGVVTSVAISPDGKKIVSGSEDGTAKMWDVATVQCLFTVTQPGKVLSVAFSPDGSTFLAGGDGVVLCDTATGDIVNKYLGHVNWVTSVAFSADGSQVLTGSQDGAVYTWNKQ